MDESPDHTSEQAEVDQPVASGASAGGYQIELPGLLEVEKSTSFSNHAALTATASELFIDFYLIEPMSAEEARYQHVARIALPFGVAVGLRLALERVLLTNSDARRILESRYS